MTLIKRNNWVTPFDLFNELERDFSSEKGLLSTNFAPDLDLEETEQGYQVHVDLPGVKKEDLQISVTDNVLSITGNRKEVKEDKKKDHYHYERRFGSFSRIVELPSEVDAEKIKATYKDGVLEIDLPKSEKAKPKQIKVDIK